jgi:surface protein
MLKRWDVSGVNTMDRLFFCCYTFNQELPWDTRSLVSAQSTFGNCYDLVDLQHTWNTKRLESARNMFYNCHKLRQDLNDWDVRSVSEFNNTFGGCYAMHRGLVRSWSTQNALAVPVVASLPSPPA